MNDAVSPPMPAYIDEALHWIHNDDPLRGVAILDRNEAIPIASFLRACAYLKIREYRLSRKYLTEYQELVPGDPAISILKDEIEQRLATLPLAPLPTDTFDRKKIVGAIELGKPYLLNREDSYVRIENVLALQPLYILADDLGFIVAESLAELSDFEIISTFLSYCGAVLSPVAIEDDVMVLYQRDPTDIRKWVRQSLARAHKAQLAGFKGSYLIPIEIDYYRDLLEMIGIPSSRIHVHGPGISYRLNAAIVPVTPSANGQSVPGK